MNGKSSRLPGQGSAGFGAAARKPAKTEYAFQTPITYQNEQEIMRRIFGSQRPASDYAFHQLNESIYAKRNASIYDAMERQSNNKAGARKKSPSKKQLTSHQQQ